MCWINWFIKFWVNKENSIKLITNMNKSIHHRWPDDEWFFVDTILENIDKELKSQIDDLKEKFKKK